jgi:hypothetical protein
MSESNTLDEKIIKYKGLEEEIKKTKEDLSKKLIILSNEKENLTKEIGDYLGSGFQSNNPIDTYCFLYFMGNENIKEKIKLLKDFTNDIKKHIGQKILYEIGEIPLETGIIKGECLIKKMTKDSYLDLYVPIEDKKILDTDKGNRKDNNEEYIYVDRDFFKYPGFKMNYLGENGPYYSTDYSKATFIGGKRPNNKRIYIGDKLVDVQLNRKIRYNKNIEITVRK